MPKYILNKETLEYEEIVLPGHIKLTRGLLLFAGSFAASVFWVWLYVSVLGFDLPKTAFLKKANARLTSELEILNSELDRNAGYLLSFQKRDNDVYRSVFGMNTIPDEVRNAGFGGVNRYSYLDGIDRSGILRKTEMKMDILTKKAYVQSLSFDEVESVAKKSGDMAACIPSVPPVLPDRTSYRLSSSFGYRSDPFTGAVKRHTGMDFACKTGNPVYATAGGVVESVRKDRFGYGLFLTVDHGFGYKTRYAHMDEILVEAGDSLKRGDLIGLSGNSGRSSGPHLHYEVIYRGAYVNPANYMDLDMAPEEYAQMTEKASGRTEQEQSTES